MRKLALRRTPAIRGETPRKKPTGTPVAFHTLRAGEYFSLQPSGYSNIYWIKMSKTGASPDDPGDDSGWPRQYFPADFPVYKL